MRIRRTLDNLSVGAEAIVDSVEEGYRRNDRQRENHESVRR